MNNIHINNRKGFTLIELLVVISIIALLVSIIMPSLGTARQLAQRAACMATLKGIGQAWNMYLDSYDRKWPLKNADGKFIVEIPDEVKDGVFYADDAPAYTINDAMKDFFPSNGYKCSSNQGKEVYDTHGSSYSFGYELTYALELLDGSTIQGIDTNGLIRACDAAASSTPVVLDYSQDSGPHRINPNEDSMAGYIAVYHDAHVEMTNSTTFEENVKALLTALVGAEAAGNYME